MSMIKFGPSGNSLSFFDEGNSSTLQMPKWLSGRGLDVFEYSFGRGINITEATARAIGEEAARYGIELTVHAPYYINFASVEDDKAANSNGYVLGSLRALKWFGGKRCVFHSGAEGKQPRAEAVGRIMERLKQFAVMKKDAGFEDLIVCPETMGKLAQIGTVEEICAMCNLDESFYPCIDFGHVNARERGSLKTKADFKAIVDYMLNAVGEEKTKNMHVHFSKIMYTDKGEVKHLTYLDDVYGPEFYPFAEVIAEYGLTPYIISEADGTQAEEAAMFKKDYLSALAAL